MCSTHAIQSAPPPYPNKQETLLGKGGYFHRIAHDNPRKYLSKSLEPHYVMRCHAKRRSPDTARKVEHWAETTPVC